MRTTRHDRTSAGGGAAGDRSGRTPVHDQIHDEEGYADEWHYEEEQEPPHGLDADPWC